MLVLSACAPSERVVTVHRAKHVVPVANANWRVRSHQPTSGITGYADQTDVLPGGLVHFFVSTSATSYTVTAYRIGWYDGKGAGRVWQSRPRAGVVQPKAVVSPDTNTVVAPWKKSFTAGTAGWPEGAYLFVLSASDGSSHYVPVVLRSRTVVGKVVLIDATATWQGENTGGAQTPST